MEVEILKKAQVGAVNALSKILLAKLAVFLGILAFLWRMLKWE
jgi:hypothetical protein